MCRKSGIIYTRIFNILYGYKIVVLLCTNKPHMIVLFQITRFFSLYFIVSENIVMVQWPWSETVNQHKMSVLTCQLKNDQARHEKHFYANDPENMMQVFLVFVTSVLGKYGSVWIWMALYIYTCLPTETGWCQFVARDVAERFSRKCKQEIQRAMCLTVDSKALVQYDHNLKIKKHFRVYLQRWAMGQWWYLNDNMLWYKMFTSGWLHLIMTESKHYVSQQKDS